MLKNKIIVLEFNELCSPLLKEWMGRGLLPNFHEFYRSSEVFTATADDEEHLEPWIQWYSIHTGLSYRQHGVFNLTDGPAACHVDIWQTLLREGLTVASCSSMNVKGFMAPGCLYLPDPWCTSETPFPKQYAAYQSVISQLVQQSSTGGKGSLGLSGYLRLGLFLIVHGIQPSTIMAGIKQLWSDIVMRRPTAWRRAMLLDRLQFDLFRHYWFTDKPDFATFFLNSTAHYQHAYWHCLFPEDFGKGPEDQEVLRFKDSILTGYIAMDKLLEKCKAFEKEGATLVLATGLSQHSNAHSDLRFYRNRDVTGFLRMLDIFPLSVLPVMAEQYSLVFEDANTCELAKTKLKSLRCGGQQLLYLGDSRDNAVLVGCRIRDTLPSDAVIETEQTESLHFHEHYYALSHTKSGTHHPDSVLWFKTGHHEVHKEKVSILDIFPTLLDFFDIDMRREPELARSRAGRSILSPTKEPLTGLTARLG
jgi:hypothetical protein